MDTVEFSAEICPLTPQIGAKLNDNTPSHESTIDKLALLLDATEAVEQIALAETFGRAANLRAGSLSALGASLEELRARLLADLPGGTVYQKAVGA